VDFRTTPDGHIGAEIRVLADTKHTPDASLADTRHTPDVSLADTRHTPDVSLADTRRSPDVSPPHASEA
jgi:hypothetical protein